LLPETALQIEGGSGARTLTNPPFGIRCFTTLFHQRVLLLSTRKYLYEFCCLVLNRGPDVDALFEQSIVKKLSQLESMSIFYNAFLI